MSSPTQRTKAELLKNGWEFVAIVERWNAFARIRQDLFGVIDILAIRCNSTGCFGVQATSASNVAARMKKSMAEPRLRTWLAAGNRYAVVGWSKRGVRGQRKKWEPVWREITLASLGDNPKAAGLVRMEI